MSYIVREFQRIGGEHVCTNALENMTEAQVHELYPYLTNAVCSFGDMHTSVIKLANADNSIIIEIDKMT